MSNWAMGWCQRQRLGDPIAKAVLSTMCYVMRDDTLAVYVGIPTLEQFTEYEDRAIRKAIARLVETAVLVDTGLRRNNVPVYRIPGYEAWLVAQQSSHPQDGRAVSVDAVALAQVAELFAQKKVGKGGANKPPQTGEGSHQAPPSSSTSPPVDVPQALPKAGPNLGSDQKNLNPSAGARAIPSGSRAAGDDAKPYDHAARAEHWRRMAVTWVVGECNGFGVTTLARQWSDLPTGVRLVLPEKIEAAVVKATDRERDTLPLSERTIRDELQQFLSEELRQFKPSSVADRAAAHAA